LLRVDNDDRGAAGRRRADRAYWNGPTGSGIARPLPPHRLTLDGDLVRQRTKAIENVMSARHSVITALLGVPLLSPQGSPPFEVLSVPEPRFGTCVPLGTSPTQTKSRLVIKSLPPGSDRDITLLVDGSGRTIGYSDRVGATRDSLSRAGTSVTASVDQAGNVIGWVTRVSVAYPAVPRDLAALRVMSDSAKKDASSRPLTVAEQNKVKEMVRFLRKRCPP